MIVANIASKAGLSILESSRVISNGEAKFLALAIVMASPLIPFKQAAEAAAPAFLPTAVPYHRKEDGRTVLLNQSKRIDVLLAEAGSESVRLSDPADLDSAEMEC